MDMRKLVGRNFARLRREKGLTQEEVEARSGFSQQYLSSLERGRRNPTVITLFEPVVAAVLAVLIVGERLPPLGWIGVALVIGCLAIITLPLPSRLRRAAPAPPPGVT